MGSRVMLVLLALTWLVAPSPSWADTVRGVVIERGTPNPIDGATVLSEHGEITVTDVDGYFAIELPRNERELTVAAAGYATATVRILGAAHLTVALVKTSGAEVIEIEDKAPEETKPLSYALTADEIRVIPGAGNDVLRAVQALPGVARVPYSFGGLVLRGMSPRDTTVQLDGIDVPLAFHFGGVTSFYPGGMLEDLTLTSGGFDASVGRTQGGVVQIKTREPRTDRWRMGGSIGLLDSSVQLEGPLPKGGGVIAGLRRSYFDAIVAPFAPDDTPLPSYWDFQLRTGWGDARTSGRIAPMVFGSIDQVRSTDVAATSSFVRVAAPFHRQWNKLGLHVVPWIGWNVLRFEDKEDDQTFSRPTFPGGVTAELVRDYAWGHVRGGAELGGGYLAQTEVEVTGSEGPDELRGSSTIAWTDLAAWGEVRYQLDGDRMAIKPGVRVEVYGLTRGTPQNSVGIEPADSTAFSPVDGPQIVVDPRINLHQRLTETTTLRQAIGRYHQPPTPGDIEPANGNPGLDSSYVDQLSLGVDTLLARDIALSVTGFFHYGRNLGVQLRNPRPGSEAPGPSLGGLGPMFQLLLERQLGFAIYRENVGRARSAGIELLAKRNVGNLFTMVSYTLAIAQRTDDPRARNIVLSKTAWRPFELDQRHNLQVAVSRRWEKWRLGARLQIVSGNPYSPTVLGVNEQPVQTPWSGTLPTFISLDLRFDRRWHRCWGDINLYIDIQNATNHHNVEGREFGADTDEDVAGLPIIPFIGVEFLPLR